MRRLTYPFLESGAVEAMYGEARVASQAKPADMVGKLPELPLAFQPGINWPYGFSHDVLVYLVEVVSGQAYDHFLSIVD